MSDHIKKPLFQQLGSTIQGRIESAQSLLGKALPCRVVAVTGALVTVAFEVITDFTLPQVTMPLATSQYIRAPVQVGDKGVAIPADALLGGVSGQSGVTPLLAQKPSNLGALFFLPLGNVSFPATDPLMVQIAGPNGVLLSDAAMTTTVLITPSGIALTNSHGVALICGANSIIVNSSGVNVTGTLLINGVDFMLHYHTLGTSTGTPTPAGDTGYVVP